MVDEVGTALTAIEPGGLGRVRTHGEIWTATADDPIAAGAAVRVTAVNGLRLRVTALGSDRGQTRVVPAADPGLTRTDRGLTLD